MPLCWATRRSNDVILSMEHHATYWQSSTVPHNFQSSLLSTTDAPRISTITTAGCNSWSNKIHTKLVIWKRLKLVKLNLPHQETLFEFVVLQFIDAKMTTGADPNIKLLLTMCQGRWHYNPFVGSSLRTNKCDRYSMIQRQKQICNSFQSKFPSLGPWHDAIHTIAIYYILTCTCSSRDQIHIIYIQICETPTRIGSLGTTCAANTAGRSRSTGVGCMRFQLVFYICTEKHHISKPSWNWRPWAWPGA